MKKTADISDVKNKGSIQKDNNSTFSDMSDCIDEHVREITGTEEGKLNLKLFIRLSGRMVQI
ncbi:hypothetical protein [Aquiflexum sp.]|uniref:hypothetical protein n=1 Tax=Aquiflexum sp. TaxID=1872584 RepID=UPI00359471D1